MISLTDSALSLTAPAEIFRTVDDDTSGVSFPIRRPNAEH
jgi:hypothetical protein